MAGGGGIAELHRELGEAAEEYARTREPGALERLDAGFQRFAQLATLFLVSERDTYYGYFFMSMTFRANFSTDALAGILLDAYPPVFEANPLRLFRLTLREIMYVFCHEVDHVVFNHPAEMVRSNPERDPGLFRLFNYAADASVNDQLNREVALGRRFLSPPGGIITSELLARRYGIPEVEPCQDYLYYFNLIRDRAGQEGEPPLGGTDPGEGDDEARGSDATDNTGTAGAATAAGEGDLRGRLIGNHAWESAPEGDGDAPGTLDEMLESATKELLNDVSELMGAEARGMMPARFTRRIEQITAPAKLNWRQILKQYVGTVSAEKTKTRARLNRRQPLRYDLSGTKESKTLKIVVAVDTSGSMDAERLRQTFAEIFEIVAHRRSEVTVVECDAAVQRVYRVKSPAEVVPDVSGGGGTRFTPAIEYVNEHRYFRDALLVYFTDGFGERSIPRPRTYRNLWVVSNAAGHLSVEQPYGLVLPLED